MAFYYTTPAKVREHDAMLSSESPDSIAEFTDAVINSTTENHTQPYIDSRLEPAGFTVPFTEDDDSGIIAMVASLWTAALLISAELIQFAAANPDKADRLKARANSFLDGIVDGTLYISHPKTKPSVDVIFDKLPLTRPVDESIVGYDGTDWQAPVEAREVKSKKFYIAHTSDPHFYVSGGIENFRTCVSWLNDEAAEKAIKALVITGDYYDRDEYSVDFETFLRGTDIYTLTGNGDTRGCNLKSTIEFLPVPGNWDTGVDPSEDPPIADDPFATFRARHSSHFGDELHYTWEHRGLVKIFVINDIADYTRESNGFNAYWNCNPPGAKTGPPTNPDFSGITTEGSELNTWLDEQFNSAHPWKIIAMHRPLYSTRDEGSRRLNVEARPFFATLVDRQLSLILSGDLHLCSVTGPWNQQAPDYETLKKPGQNAVYEIVSAGGYLSRASVPGTLPDEANSVLFESGRDGLSSNKAHMTLLGFEEGVNTIDVTIFEAWRDNTAGSVVYSGKLVQNRGSF